MGKVMSWLTSSILLLIHVAYSIANAATSLHKRHSARDPQPLAVHRKQVPAHIALLFTCDDDRAAERFEKDMLANVEQAVAWCRVVGMKRLTVYDRKGILARSSFTLRAHLQPEAIEDDSSTSESEIDYPLTPPLSDDSGSRPLSPQREVPLKLHVTTLKLSNLDGSLQSTKKRHNGRTLSRRHPHRNSLDPVETSFALHIISRDSGKPAISNAATRLAHQYQNSLHTDQDSFTVEQSVISSMLEGKHGFPSPDLMIIHNILPHKRTKNVMELHGFPPWQTRLTEFHYNQYPTSAWSRWRLLWNPPYVALEEVEFRRALDEYAAAEMRLGK